MTRTCQFCHTEIGPGQLPYCSLDHLAWHILGKPPLADILRQRLADGWAPTKRKRT